MTIYDLHGLGLAVDGAAADALDRRLRAFPRAARADLHLHYVAEAPPAPAGPSRSVYEAGGSDVRHHPDDDVLTATLAGVHLHADLRRGVTHIACQDFSGRSRYVASNPFATLALMEMLKRRGTYFLHAACLAKEGRAVVIAGQAGAGKSTLALALARHGLDYLGDDMVFLRAEAGTVRALGFSDAIGITANTAQWLPELAELARREPEPGYPKYLGRVEDHFAARVVTEAAPRAIVFPQIVPGDDSRLEPLAGNEAWLRLVPDVLLTEPASTQAHLNTIAALTRQAESHTLYSSRDLDASARLVAGLL
jgi:hypothetical protein